MRIAIVGIGNELNGDDAAGVLVVRALRKKLVQRGMMTDAPLLSSPCQPQPAVLVIEAGPAPEGFTGPLRRYAPGWVILVDAAEMTAQPGTIAWVEWGDADGWSGSTHALPPTVLGEFLMKELGCRVSLLGIQPARLDFDSGVSTPVKLAVRKAVNSILERIT